ncbi:DUF1353 domain-containing protein [Ferruginibacter yonginensis]|uniref:DUF1353 domain-containing protein n=1 Tax=Ferruginibacter yonginensis TaxID=1310416 RepID=A0ABV8QRL0_9BACT
MKVIKSSNVLALATAAEVYYDTPLFTNKGVFRAIKTSVCFELSNGSHLIIREGMYWDENSIPYLLQWAFPKSGKYAVPALIHDALYYKATTTQKFADDEFKYWMQHLNISKFQIAFRYYAVRLFGGSWFKKNVTRPGERCLHNKQLIDIV